MQIKDKIRSIRKGLGLTQQQFADELGIKRSLIGAYEEGRAEPRLELLNQMAALGGITLDNIFSSVSGQERDTPSKNIDNTIQFVPVKAAAGYLRGYGDSDTLSTLPTFSIPNLGRGDYRAFEIAGDSMLPIPSGTIIIGQRIENIGDLKHGKTYVLVTKKEGVVYKRLNTKLKDADTIELISDNSAFTSYKISTEEILEAWSAKAYIGFDFPVLGT